MIIHELNWLWSLLGIALFCAFIALLSENHIQTGKHESIDYCCSHRILTGSPRCIYLCQSGYASIVNFFCDIEAVGPFCISLSKKFLTRIVTRFVLW